MSEPRDRAAMVQGGGAGRAVPRPWATAAALLVALTLVSGCHRKPTYTPPATYPVTGKVVAVSGKIPPNALIRFVPEDGQLAGEGMIQPDGSFTLRTLFHEQWLDGAIAGPRHVEIVVPLGADRLGGRTIDIKDTFTIEPKENHFTVTLK